MASLSSRGMPSMCVVWPRCELIGDLYLGRAGAGSESSVSVVPVS
jgi:hypothetical protein